MKTFFYIIMGALCITFTSCFEVLEEVNLKSDQSGELLFTVNASQSKTKLNSILSLDSFRGMEVPNQDRINQEINQRVVEMNQYSGIKASVSMRDFENYIFAIKIAFEHIDQLNAAAKELKKKHTKSQVMDSISVDKNHFQRFSLWQIDGEKKRFKAEDFEVLNKAFYTCIYRFDKPIKSSNRDDVRISGSKKAVMLKLPVSELINQNKTLNQTLTFQ